MPCATADYHIKIKEFLSIISISHLNFSLHFLISLSILTPLARCIIKIMGYPEIMNAPYPSMMSLRSPHDTYRSLPNTPLAIDQRAMAPSDMNLAINHARMGLEVPDYFNGGASGMNSRFSSSGLRPRSPYPTELAENERYQSFEPDHISPDMICRFVLCNPLFFFEVIGKDDMVKTYLLRGL